ncbi:MAG: hypothetical protein K0S33_4025 [Bacteroidetes bacterium]|jgi:hypothetical protein|nr:hypothetical protein [Bacteroidota bacterium]
MKTFETDIYTMTIHDDGLIEFRVKKNKTFREEDVWQSRDQSVEYMPGRKFFVLMESEENFNATVGARRAGASEEYTHHVKAVAMYSSRMHESIMGSIYLKISKPKVPTKFFDDREKAIAWLRSQM